MRIYFYLLCMLGILGSCAHSEPEYVLPTARMGDYESDESGFHSKTLFYDNGHEVVVFDSQFTPELAEKAIDFIRSETSHPIKYVVLTHPGSTKFNGLEPFKKIGAKIISSRATASSLGEVHQYAKNDYVKIRKTYTQETYPKLIKPDIIFENQYSIKLSHGETVELLELSKSGPGSNQTIAHVPRVQALVVGDLVNYKTHAWLEGGIYQGVAVAKLKNWITDLNEVNSLFSDKNVTVYGRGTEASLDAAIEFQVNYLEKIDNLVTEYVKDLAARGRKKKDLTDPVTAKGHYIEMTKRIEALFPGFKNGHLLKESIHGLVNAKL